MPDAAETRFKKQTTEKRRHGAPRFDGVAKRRAQPREPACCAGRPSNRSTFPLRFGPSCAVAVVLGESRNCFGSPTATTASVSGARRSACRVLRGLHGDALLLERRRLPPDRVREHEL